MLALPGATPVAKPVAEMVAIPGFELAHVALAVTSTVFPSVYSAVAVSCCVAPTAKPDTTLRDIEMEDIVGLVSGSDTFIVNAGLVTPELVTVISVLPAALPVAKPMVEILATVGTELSQIPVKVTSSVDPFEKVPLAVNCWVAFTVKLNGEDCLIVMDNNFTTGKVTAWLRMSSKDAVISVLPIVIPVTTPLAEMVAVSVLELVQVTRDVMSAVDPSVYVPVAVNCCREPICKLFGSDGLKAMDDNLGLGEQPPITKARIINPTAKQ
jgi:hypothetical protein